MRKIMMAAAFALGSTSIAMPATAQLVGGGLVVVNVSNVANDLAKNLKVDVSNIPVTVQAPVAVAAAVCGLDVNALAQQKQEGDRTCNASTTNDALNKIVQKSLTKQ